MRKGTRRGAARLAVALLLLSVMFIAAASPSLAEEYVVHFGDQKVFGAADPAAEQTASVAEFLGIDPGNVVKVYIHLNGALVDFPDDMTIAPQNEAFGKTKGAGTFNALPADTPLYPAVVDMGQAVGPDGPMAPAISEPWNRKSASSLIDAVNGDPDALARLADTYVFIMDSGINGSDYLPAPHPDYSTDFVTDDPNDGYGDINGHGTAVAGMVAGVDVGVAEGVNLVALRIGDSEGNTNLGRFSDACDYIAGLAEGDLSGKKIIANASYSTAPSDTGSSLYDLWKAPSDALMSRGVLLFVAAGNHSADVDVKYVWPARVENANTIACANMVSSGGAISESSNYGDQTIEGLFPGTNVTSTSWNGGYSVGINGTSFSSPWGAGAAALVWALRPDLEYWAVRNVLIRSTPYSIYGYLAPSGNMMPATSQHFIDRAMGNIDDFLGLEPNHGDASSPIAGPAEIISGEHVDTRLPGTGAAVPPYNLSPTGGTHETGSSVVLEWECDLPGDGIGFDVYVLRPGQQNATRVSTVDGHSASYAYTPSQVGGYQWSVTVVQDGYVSIASKETGAFTAVAPPDPPDDPSDPSNPSNPSNPSSGGGGGGCNTAGGNALWAISLMALALISIGGRSRR